jgi:hypothetical protein
MAIAIHAATTCCPIEESRAQMGIGFGSVYLIAAQPRAKLERDYKLAIRMRPELE